MKVMFNGERTPDIFFPTRGIRQGDPLSPYLFVLCVEKLDHCINDAISVGRWKPIVISRGGPPISHFFFCG